MKTSVIIPAYNEEKNIEKVLEVVTVCPGIDEIIVVSDGSTDETASIARQYAVQVVELKENHGKGGALKIGLDNSRGDIIMFLDADLTGLTVKHIQNMLEPVWKNEADMVIGVFDQGRLTTDLAQIIAPYLSGQRVVKRSVLNGLKELEMTGFGVELALTRYCKEKNLVCKEVKLDKMSHIMKEEKLGVIRGFLYRLKMYWEILKVFGKRRSSL